MIGGQAQRETARRRRIVDATVAASPGTGRELASGDQKVDPPSRTTNQDGACPRCLAALALQCALLSRPSLSPSGSPNLFLVSSPVLGRLFSSLAADVLALALALRSKPGFLASPAVSCCCHSLAWPSPRRLAVGLAARVGAAASGSSPSVVHDRDRRSARHRQTRRNPSCLRGLARCDDQRASERRSAA